MGLGDAAQLGYESYVGLAPETEWGTHITATTFFEYSSESFKKTRDPKVIEALGSTGRNPLKRFLGNKIVVGSIECNLNIMEDACAHIINNAIGGKVTSALLTGGSATDTSSYEHDLSQGAFDGTVTSLSMLTRKGPGQLFEWNGCRVNSLSIKVDGPGAPVVMSAELIGKDGTVSTDEPTVVINANRPLLGQDVSFYSADSEGALWAGSGTAETILGFEFNYNNNLISDDNARQLGSVELGVLPAGKATASLKIKMRYDTATTIYDRAFGESEAAYMILITSNITLGTDDDDTSASMAIVLPCAYVDTEGVIPEVGDPGILLQEVMLTPLQPSTDAQYVHVKYYNTTTEYVA